MATSTSRRTVPIVIALIVLAGAVVAAALLLSSASQQTATTTKTVTAAPTATATHGAYCQGADTQNYSDWVNANNRPGTPLWTAYTEAASQMKQLGVQGSMDPSAIVLTLALRCYAG